MTEADFKRLAAEGFDRVPLVLEAFADLDTPLSIYLKLANRADTYLLESVVGGERFDRYCFVGLAAPVRMLAREYQVSVLRGDDVIDTASGDPLESVRTYLKRTKAAPLPGLPRFRGGLVGYFGYDAVRWIEGRLSGGWLKPDTLGAPDMLLLLSEEIAVVDNLTGKLYLVVFADPAKAGAHQDTPQRLRELLGALRPPLALPQDTVHALAPATSNFGEAAFIAAVARAKNYIVEGDIMQVVLSQRMSRPFAASPLALYRALRTINPSPLHVLFQFPRHSGDRRIARNHGAPRTCNGDGAADRRHAAARQGRGRGRGAGRRTARRPQRARRAPHAA